MGTIFVLAEHRKGTLRDVTKEMLAKGAELAAKSGGNLTAVLLGKNVRHFADELAKSADQVILVEDDSLENYNSDTYQPVISSLIDEYQPQLTLIGHTAAGMDLAPRLAAEKKIGLTTDCIDLSIVGGKFAAIRQMYGGKVNADIDFSSAEKYMATLRPGIFTSGATPKQGQVKSVQLPKPAYGKKKFIEYLEAVAGAVDITLADVLVSVGQGVGDAKNIPMMEDFAKALGATLSCSRPVVDRKWLPKERQVGSSGKTVKPKVYLAVGISGAFQHVTAVKADTIIAINKDPRAPIFQVADYGIVGDLFQVLPKVKEKVIEMRSCK
ncbi:MAG: hypothetical protein A2Z02_07505 [Chloroflexi bacterium RBG_16_48_7]|nr:MAG: hypothetical protein A2Z02_07505 [Chloroflexi bacterium RBG_16_48_7]